MSINNWNKACDKNALSIIDKVKALLNLEDKLVLVQKHELQRIFASRKYKHNEGGYVDYLYGHYIINKNLKTYLCENQGTLLNSKSCMIN